MDDLTRIFPGCILGTEELRERIRKLMGIEDGYCCYKCFRLLGLHTMPKDAELCKICYQFYCKDCAKLLYSDPAKHEIDPYRCIQCIETRRFQLY